MYAERLFNNHVVDDERMKFKDKDKNERTHTPFF
jgi:hypothetical protein